MKTQWADNFLIEDDNDEIAEDSKKQARRVKYNSWVY